MKILIVGSDYNWSIERLYLKYLKIEPGLDVQLFPAQNFLFSYLDTGIAQKVFFRISPNNIFRKIGEELLSAVSEFKPEVVWVFKGMEILPEVLKKLKNKGIFLVNYNPDNPFIFTGRGSGNSNVTNSIFLYDLHFTYSLEIKKELLKMGLPTKLLPFAYDEIPGYDYSVFPTEKEEINKVCFIGNPDEQRVKFIKELLNHKIPVDVFGNHWSRFFKSSSCLNLFPPVYEKEFAHISKKYRVCLNILRLHNLKSHNMRSFEIAGTGGIQLAPKTSEHELFFEPNKEIFLYDSIKCAVKQVNYLFSLSNEEIVFIRKSARLRYLNSGYGYKDRSLFALTEIKKLIN